MYVRLPAPAGVKLAIMSALSVKFKVIVSFKTLIPVVILETVTLTVLLEGKNLPLPANVIFTVASPAPTATKLPALSTVITEELLLV